MRWQHLVIALALLLLAGVNRLSAEDKKPPAKGHSRLDAMAERLGLSSEQKEQVRKIHHEFDQKEDKVEHQIREHRHAEFGEVRAVLTEDQRKKMPGLLKAEMEKELHQVGDKLGLSDKQKESIHKIRHDYDQKIDKVVATKSPEAAAEARKLRREEFAAIRHELTEDQRHKLPGMFRSETRMWRDPAERRKRLKALGDKLNLSEGQKKQIGQTHAKHDPEVAKLQAQLRDLRMHEREAVSKVLTEEQRKKLQQLREGRGGRTKPGS